MHAPDTEFDPDDNYASGFEPEMEIDEEAGTEALVWQLLLLINPGDETRPAASALAGGDHRRSDEEFEPAWVLKDIIDWKSGFQIHDDDATAFVEAISELVSRWNLELDWGVDDPTDDEFLDSASVPGLLQVAYDALRSYGYTLWVWETGTESTAGWIALSRDDDAMRVIAPALGIELRRPGLTEHQNCFTRPRSARHKSSCRDRSRWSSRTRLACWRDKGTDPRRRRKCRVRWSWLPARFSRGGGGPVRAGCGRDLALEQECSSSATIAAGSRRSGQGTRSPGGRAPRHRQGPGGRGGCAQAHGSDR